MRKFFIILSMLLFAQISSATTIEAGVSADYFPKALFGSWRVNAKLDTTNSPSTFKPQSADFWNLSRIEDKITLENPFSGANCEILVKTVEGNIVVFSKKLPYDNNKILTDTVTIRLMENQFSGINTLTLESYSLIDKHLLKTETATYKITGEKIAGDSILKN